MKRLTSALLSLTMILCLTPAAAADGTPDTLRNFTTVNKYDGRFDDIKEADWFFFYVATVYELDLMKGDSERLFNPSGNMTVAEAITTAARLNSIYYLGKAEFEQGQVWYQPYVDHAIQKGIIRKGQFSDYEAPVTRAQFAAVMAAALPKEALAEINTIEVIPDVKESGPICDSIFTLYLAGILTGNDKAGTFAPNSKIQRSEASAILARMAMPSLRQRMTLKAESVEEQSAVNIKPSATVVLGERRPINAKVLPDDKPQRGIRWQSADPSIASVDQDGFVTGVSAGQTVITATTADGAAGKCAVSVTDMLSADAEYRTKAMADITELLKKPETFHMSAVMVSRFPYRQDNVLPEDDNQYYIFRVIFDFSVESTDGEQVKARCEVYYDMDTEQRFFGQFSLDEGIDANKLFYIS